MRLLKTGFVRACALLLIATHPAVAQRQGEPVGRRTSEPYKGDLEIFEAPDRAEKLQVDRVMDLLGIRSGSRVADIGAARGGSRSARRGVSADPAW